MNAPIGVMAASTDTVAAIRAAIAGYRQRHADALPACSRRCSCPSPSSWGSRALTAGANEAIMALAETNGPGRFAFSAIESQLNVVGKVPSVSGPSVPPFVSATMAARGGHSAMDPKIVARFWSKVSKTAGGCWEWTAVRTRLGYGQFSVRRRMVYSHRFSYELRRGPVPAGLELDHLCRNPSCVNPDHLEAVTHRENALRGESMPARYAARTCCSRGHEYTPENTRVTKRGARLCRICDRARDRARRPRSYVRRTERRHTDGNI